MRLDHDNPQHNNGGGNGGNGGFSSWRSDVGADVRRAWPDAVAFREAIQSPASVLSDPEITGSAVALDRMGMPLAYSGRFAIVFRLTNPRGERWALRCFTSPGEDGRGAARANRYKIIAEHTTKLDNTFVPFRYVNRGIKVGQEWYPVVAMRWASGKPLGRWVEDHLNDPPALRRLCASLSGLLERLEAAGLAHGDWQHDNLLISEEGARVTLVDYDGMYVPEFAGLQCSELGHPNYQHPDRSTSHFGPGLDRFACLVIETALLALAHDPSLWARFADGESLLFKRHDFSAPEYSPAFAAVRGLAREKGDEELAESLLRLEDACRAGAQSTLLPAVAAGPAPSSLLEHLESERKANVENFWQQVPLPSPASGKKWYQIPETKVALSAGQPAARASYSSRPPTTVAASTAGTEYLQRLETEETLKEEQWHLWRWRGGALAFNGFLVAMLYHWLFQNGWPPFYFLWVLNFAGLGYGRWPRKRIYEELIGEIGKMENLIADRAQRIQAKGGGSVPASLNEFVNERLRQTPINRILPVPGVEVPTLRAMRQYGIDNLLEFRRRFGSANDPGSGIPQGQIDILRRWCDDLEREAANDYPSLVRTVPVEVDRLRHEQAEFERHAAELKRERDRFPDASFGAYLRKLVGAGENGAASSAAGNGPAAHP